MISSEKGNVEIKPLRQGEAQEELRKQREPEEQKQAEEKERRMREEEDARRREESAAAERKAAEEAAMKRASTEQAKQEEARLASERAQEKEREALRQAAERAEKKRREEEREAAQEKVNTWCKASGYPDMNSCKKSFMRGSQFPLHEAVAKKNDEMVTLLTQLGVDKGATNSKGQTAIAIAQKMNKGGSMEGIIAKLT
jgi:membrane protein involved in colicin uptake